MAAIAQPPVMEKKKPVSFSNLLCKAYKNLEDGGETSKLVE